MKSKMLITIIGPFGEIGGVSIHIKRLTELLQGHCEFLIINESRVLKYNDSRIINLRSYPLGKYLGAIIKADIVHIHSGSNTLRLFHLLVSFFLRSKSVITLHSYRKLSRFLNFFLRNLPTRVVAVSQEIHTKIGVKNSVVLNAFIPPISEKNEQLEDDINKLIDDLKAEGRVIVAGNAFRLVEYNGKDLYGIDQLIELAEKLKLEKLKVAIVFFVSSLVNSEKKYHQYIRLIKDREIKENIYLMNRQVSFIKIIQKSDLVVRPTLSDGDALTIREALYFDKQVIASDVVKRPEGTILYKTANVKDLLSKLKKVLSNTIQQKKIESIDQDYENTYRKIYEASNPKFQNRRSLR